MPRNSRETPPPISVALRLALPVVLLCLGSDVFGEDNQPRDGQVEPGAEEEAGTTRSILSPHKRNYILLYTLDRVNAPDERQEKEAKFQISIKAYLPGALPWYIGYTQKSFWQVYDRERSRPFRESNYNPELFLDWQAPLGAPRETYLRYGIEHESNGQSIALSRSWNRVFLWPRYEGEDWDFALKYWWRLPEKDKDSPGDPDGDDNPDIDRYLGRFEAYVTWHPANWAQLALMLRKGTRDHSGTYEVDASFGVIPRYEQFRLLVQYFSGYGESLIDYNRRVEKVGIGLAFQ